MGKAVIFIGTTWAAVVTAFLGMDDDRAALGLLAMMAVPATAGIIAFMIVEYRRTWGGKITREQV